MDTPVSNRITQGAKEKQELKRTAGELAVSLYEAGGAGSPVPSPVSASVAGETLGGEGGQSPPLGGGGGGYLDAIANVVTSVPTVGTKTSSGFPVKCPGFFVVGECQNGHRFAKELYCGREWCPVCGEDESPSHMRRFARWVGKAQQLPTMGYLVFTLPEEVRGRYRSKTQLNELTKRVTAGDKSRRIEGMLVGLGFERGLARWHWFGDAPGKWHPHLNVIIESGYLTPAQLQGIRCAWAGILGVDVAVVNYSYTKVVPKMIHILKYVTRATFRDYIWDERMAGALWNFRNMRSWGNWSGPAVWELEGDAKAGGDRQSIGHAMTDGELEPITDLESGLCPVCGEPVNWGQARDITWLEGWAAAGQAEPMGAGYWWVLPDAPRPAENRFRLWEAYYRVIRGLVDEPGWTNKATQRHARLGRERVVAERERAAAEAEYQAVLWRDLGVK